MRRFVNALVGCLVPSAAVFAATPPSSAITVEDVMQKMSKQERFSYLTGLIDMRAFHATQSGDAKLSKCIYDNYYREKKRCRLVRAACLARQVSDEHLAAVLYLLVQKNCAS